MTSLSNLSRKERGLISDQPLLLLNTQSDERFEHITRIAKRMFNVPIALVNLEDSQDLMLNVASLAENVCCFSEYASKGKESEEGIGELYCSSYSLPDDGLFTVSDTNEDERFNDNPLVIGPKCIRFFATYPLKDNEGKLIGRFCLMGTSPKQLSAEQKELLKDLAAIAENDVRAVQLATIDELTGISNRRGFLSSSTSVLNLCARHDDAATLVFFDLNRFKAINDTFGHAEGDKALIAFASLMKATFRDSDVFARLGGDEFVVLLTNTTIQQAHDTIRRFRKSVTRHNESAGRGYSLAFSEGLVEISNQNSCSIQELLDQADASMYKNKREVSGNKKELQILDR